MTKTVFKYPEQKITCHSYLKVSLLLLPVTEKEHSAEFPPESVKVYVTVVGPTLNILPG